MGGVFSRIPAKKVPFYYIHGIELNDESVRVGIYFYYINIYTYGHGPSGLTHFFTPRIYPKVHELKDEFLMNYPHTLSSPFGAAVKEESTFHIPIFC